MRNKFVAVVAAAVIATTIASADAEEINAWAGYEKYFQARFLDENVDLETYVSTADGAWRDSGRNMMYSWAQGCGFGEIGDTLVEGCGPTFIEWSPDLDWARAFIEVKDPSYGYTHLELAFQATEAFRPKNATVTTMHDESEEGRRDWARVTGRLHRTAAAQLSARTTRLPGEIISEMDATVADMELWPDAYVELRSS